MMIHRALQTLLFGFMVLASTTCASVSVPDVCSSDGDCTQAGAGGTCEDTAYCSIADSDCPTGQRYTSNSGALSDLCVGTAVCGDSFCGGNESCITCDEDCGNCDDPNYCGDGECTEASEDCQNCERDCGSCESELFCGDGTCNGDESCADCALDCGACGETCGDGSCNGEETCRDCGIDCGVCPDEVCDDGMDNDFDDAVDEGCGGTGY